MTRLLKWRWVWELDEDNWSWRQLITGDGCWFTWGRFTTFAATWSGSSIPWPWREAFGWQCEDRAEDRCLRGSASGPPRCLCPSMVVNCSPSGPELQERKRNLFFPFSFLSWATAWGLHGWWNASSQREVRGPANPSAMPIIGCPIRRPVHGMLGAERGSGELWHKQFRQPSLASVNWQIYCSSVSSAK